jgi:hypothetical protein
MPAYVACIWIHMLLVGLKMGHIRTRILNMPYIERTALLIRKIGRMRYWVRELSIP